MTRDSLVGNSQIIRTSFGRHLDEIDVLVDVCV